jgi:hypothetical protein
VNNTIVFDLFEISNRTQQRKYLTAPEYFRKSHQRKQ